MLGILKGAYTEAISIGPELMQNHRLTTWPGICRLRPAPATVVSQATHPPGQ